ncbi:MAG: alpha-L-fucosidase [Bacteroidaceae bacterium]|nr:alpha-L-fucosidase [Bacteroidaceae bacterium]
MKKTIYALGLSLLMVGCATQPNQVYYEKHVEFPADATIEQKIDMASRLVPTAQQLEWQQMEFTAFLHFGMNTFTGNEWGHGTDSPALFNPSELDCEQWVKALKDGGFKMALITAKHHDGFCLWQTETTEYSVKNSPWKDGKGDVVRELRDACEKYGMKFGVYLSPWDRNAPSYGDSPAYNKFFIAQLTELLTNYGEVHEVWFDGACAEGPNGKKQEYDWTAILAKIRELQPKAVTAIMGDDVRWVGNEGGLGRETEWSATVIPPGSYTHKKAAKEALGLEEMSKDLGSRELVAKAQEVYWYPSEVDVSIRPGWFYHAEQDGQVRSLANLVNIYYRSVGCNSVLLLNIPPDRRGLIHEIDVQRIKELSEYINKTFATNYVEKGKQDWAAQVGESKEYDVKPGAMVNTFLIQEDITKGQRVEDFLVEVYSNGAWQYATEGTTIGYKRLLRFSDCQPEKVRVTIRGARATANISNVGLYYAEPLQDKNARVRLSDVSTSEWKAVGADAAQAFDGNTATAWTTDGLSALVVDMGKEESVAGFCYAPIAAEDLSGTIYKYNFYVSTDGQNWTKCNTNGEFSNIMHNPVPYFVRFGKNYQARYFKLEPISEIKSAQKTTIGEIGILVK